MIIKEGSNTITLRLVRQFIDDRITYLDKMWEETYEDEKLFADHCMCIGRLREMEEFSRWFKEVFETNEEGN